MVEARPLRIAFFGTPAFAVPTLDALLSSRHRVVGVVTQPDRPRGRGHKTVDAPVKASARVAAIPILQPSSLKDPEFLSAFTAWDVELGVVAAYGKILPEALLSLPPLGMINVHASLLPRYRGAAPVHRAVMHGDSETGVTIMRVVKALDAGPMLASIARPIGPDETNVEVEQGLARLGADLLVSTADRLARDEAVEIAQAEADATYAHRITKDEGLIDWRQPAVRIHNQVRGLHPWPHAFSFCEGHRIIVRRSAVAMDGRGGNPGVVLTAHGDDFLVAAREGALRLLELHVEGKRPMTAREFLAGHPLAAGTHFDLKS